MIEALPNGASEWSATIENCRVPADPTPVGCYETEVEAVKQRLCFQV